MSTDDDEDRLVSRRVAKAMLGGVSDETMRWLEASRMLPAVRYGKAKQSRVYHPLSAIRSLVRSGVLRER
jgi:hypothetical protein